MSILTVDEERRLVDALCETRATIERIIRPAVLESHCIEHFDQLLPRFIHQTAIPGTLRRRVDRWLEKYRRIKHELVVRNLAWVTKLSRRHRSTAISEEDLFQEGVCGLLRAIDRFEASRGLRLMTYSTWYILEAMQQTRARQRQNISLSVHDQTLLGRIDEARQAFLHAHGRPPTHSEIGEILGRPTTNIRKLEAAAAPSIRLDHGRDHGVIPLADSDPDSGRDYILDAQGIVDRLMKSLSQRERLIVTRRFGLNGAQPSSLEALGATLDLSKERVRQLQRLAMKRLQKLAMTNEREVVGA